MKKGWSLLFPVACCTLGNSLLSNPATAQISADGTTNTTVDVDGNNFTIGQGDRAGNNLFHSFSNFSVPTNGSAFFNNAMDVSNIFSRVTGGNISNIDGLIQANGSANLFLINPAGILFGNNAQLDIGGSFLGTTADSILFEDGVLSATDLDNPPLLTVNAPIGLNFRDNPAPIENSSTASADFDPETSFDDGLFGIRVPDGKTFALAGGDITADGGGIVAVGGRIELGAVGESGTLGINFEDDNISFNFPDDLARANVSLINNAGFLVMGSGGGDLTITANNIEILEGSGLFAGIFSGLGSPDAQAGDINLQAKESILIDGIEDSDFSGVFNEVDSDSLGNAGTLSIIATDLSVTDGAQVSTSTNGEGDGGDLVINVNESVLVDGASNNENAFTGIFNQVNSTATGNSGILEINAQNLSVVNGSRISSSTLGNGNGGKVEINATEAVLLEVGDNDAFTSIVSNVESGSLGNTEGVSIMADSLSVNRGGQIQSLVRGEGNSGKITINANSVSFDGRDQGDSPSGAFSVVTQDAIGSVGGIEIIANSFSMTNRAQLLSNTSGFGDAGNIDLQVIDGINLENSSIISEVSEGGGNGFGGDINITTTSLLLQNGSALLADAENIGDAGNININASENVILSGEGISAFPGATDLVPSQISATVESQAVGDGGNININTPALTVQDNGFISATTFGQGNAGNLTISTQKLRLEGGGELDAITFSDGNAGNLVIQDAKLIEIIGTTPNGTSPSGIFASAIEGSGNGGNLSISTDEIIIQDKAAIGVGSFQIVFGDLVPRTPGSGSPGTLDIKANSLILENGGRIDAATQSETGEGANINLQVADNITLENNSLISAQAFGDADGGNLTIDTNLIIAFPNEIPGDGSDIIASAVDGNGGNISITAESLLGISEGEAIEGNGTNDIDASSDFGLDGTISIFTPDINPIQGATELPSNIVEPNQAVAQACNNNRGVRTASSFVIDGKGGILPTPDAPMNSEIITVDGATEANSSQGYAIPTGIGDIVPARGVIKRPDGSITLTATPVAGNSSRAPNGVDCG
ncbi:MAG: filamentous hemagglutinin N-terminal domain-containing protein [Cyanobacteria bacterium P01_G01_bin.39]